MTCGTSQSKSSQIMSYGQQALSHSVTPGSLVPISSSATPGSSTISYYPDLLQPTSLSNRNDIVPLTRTNAAKKFPHTCDRWSNEQPNDWGVAHQPSIVHQHDMRNKTKLRLFNPKRTSQTRGVARDLITPTSVTSNRSCRKVTNTVRFIENLKSSEGTSLSSLQKQRLDDLLKNLCSSRVDDRIHAARSLSSLGITATDAAIPILVGALKTDTVSSVRLEMAKALLNLGEWHSLALKELTAHLRKMNPEVCTDILEQLACSSNVRLIYTKIYESSHLNQLIKVLCLLAQQQEATDDMSCQAAICIGEICGTHNQTAADLAIWKLRNFIKASSKSSLHSHALEVLVRQLKSFDVDILSSMISQLKNAIKWQDRLAAALLIAHSGPEQVFCIMQENDVFNILFPKLWDDPKRDVRLGVSQAFTALGLRNRLLEVLDNQIADDNPEIRSHGVMAMSAAGIRSDRTLRSLVEILGLDSSDYVRLQVIRTFCSLGITDIRVLRALREREKCGGPLGREASKTLSSLDIPLTAVSLTPSRQKEKSGKLPTTADGRLTNSSWPSSLWEGNYNRLNTRASQRHRKPINMSSSYHHKHDTSESYRSSGFTTTPQYEIISTSVQKARMSAGSTRAATYMTSASSFF